MVGRDVVGWIRPLRVTRGGDREYRKTKDPTALCKIHYAMLSLFILDRMQIETESAAEHGDPGHGWNVTWWMFPMNPSGLDDTTMRKALR